MIKLINNGVTIAEKYYKVKLIAIVCDGQARAFIKCIKSLTGFYAYERCTIKGSTINKKRVYPETNCEIRTKDSFIEKK